ncbi:nucleotidyltransferase domain-containing protein [Candidatus Gottesmanbacteria bacterium]|nr:nucleotidyltransferase domain-containing protein [Candidatus Gottesmanbacteria bacterium]
MDKVQKIKQKITQDLKVLKPKKIILFGSLTTGQFKKDSDIDLLIIKNTREKLADRYSKARLSLSLDYPFDIFVLSEDELKEKLTKSFFFQEIVSRGEVLYEQK